MSSDQHIANMARQRAETNPPRRTLDDAGSRLIALLRNAARQTAIRPARRLLRHSPEQVGLFFRDRVTLGFHAGSPRDHAARFHELTSIEIRSGNIRQVLGELRAFAQVPPIHSANTLWDILADLLTEEWDPFDLAIARMHNNPGVMRSETSILLTRF